MEKEAYIFTSDALEIYSVNSRCLKLQVNEKPSSIFDGKVDCENYSVLPILVKDKYTDDLDQDEFKNKSPDIISDDPILELHSLFRNFKELLKGERTPNTGSGSSQSQFKVNNTINCPESKKIILNEDEIGCCIEHKSINLHNFISNSITTETCYTAKNMSEIINENEINTELGAVCENIVEGNLDLGKDNALKSSHHFKGSSRLEQSDFAKRIQISDILELNKTNKDEVIKQDLTLARSNNNKHRPNQKNIVKKESLGFLQDDKVNETRMYSNPNYHNENGNDILRDGDAHSTIEKICMLVDNVEIDIHEAVRRDDESLVRLFLARGADPNEPDWAGKGDPPLLQAALKQNIPIIKALCEAGCDVNCTSVRGETALHMAVSRRPVNLLLLNTLLAAGCDANMQDKLRGCSPLQCISGFADDEPQVFLKLVTVSNVNLRDHRHNTVLHRVAATSNNVLWIKQLLERGADPNVQNDRGETALHVALERGWEEGALTLLAEGTNFIHTNLYRETALHVAARQNQTRVVAALMSHNVDVNAKDLAGNTALHLAAGRGFTNTVHELLTCPYLDLDSHNCDNATPLTCAVESGFISVVQMLVKAEQVDLQPALDIAKNGYRRLSQPEMCLLLTKELARRQMPNIG